MGFLPLAFGFFLSVLFRTIDSLVADALMSDLGIGEGTLGMLTAAFLLAFAACLLPSGIALDRFGPRTVQSVMMGVTALGALIFSLSTGDFGLTIGRMLLGVGTASALLAGMKAGVTWFPRERLGLVTGCLITVGGLGALAAADPAELLVRAYGWRTLFVVLAALAAICSILAWLLVPTQAAVTGDVPDQDHGVPFVLRDPLFRRFAPLAAVAVGTVWAIQGQWVARWLAEVNGLELAAVVSHISLMAVGHTAGSLVWGVLADWAGRKGLAAARVFVGAVALCVCIQVAVVGGIALPTSIVWGAFSVAGAAAMLPLVVMSAHFPQAYAGRACASVGVLQYVAAFFIQSAIGIVVATWPHEASGQTSATAYAMAFMVPIALQLAALAWFLFPRSDTRHVAQNVGEVAVADTAVEPADTAGATTDASSAPAETVAAPTDVAAESARTAVEPADTADATADAASAPAETVAAPTDVAAESARTAVEPADTAGATADAASAPAETVAAPTDAAAESARTAVEPADAAGATADAASAPAETVAAPTDAPAESARAAVEPADTTDATADAASAPAETVAAPTDAPAESARTAVEPADTAGATADAAAAPAETVAAPTDADVEPTGDLAAPGETAVAPTETALPSTLDAVLRAGLDGALGTTLRANAGTSS